jgi:hypothetical protein
MADDGRGVIGVTQVYQYAMKLGVPLVVWHVGHGIQ